MHDADNMIVKPILMHDANNMIVKPVLMHGADNIIEKPILSCHIQDRAKFFFDKR